MGFILTKYTRRVRKGRQLDDALSFSLKPPAKGNCFRTTMEAVNSTGVLLAVNDYGDHVSVFPVDYPTIEDWKKWKGISLSNNDEEHAHPYSILLKGLRR